MYKITLLLMLCLSFAKSQAKEISIPFTILDGFPMVEVSVDGEKHLFVFDTGAYRTCINSKVFPNLTVSRKIDDIGGIGSERKSMDAVNFSFHFLNQSYTHYEVISADLDLLSRISCTNLKVSGIIGRDLMENYVLEINPETKKITFYPHEDFNEKQLVGFAKIKLQKTSDPYLPITIGKQKRHVLFDTGSANGLSTTDYKLEKYIETTQHISYSSKGSSFGIHGMNHDKDIHYKVFNAALQVGSITVENQAFETSRNDFNNMGFEFSRQFISFLDLKNHQLFLKQIRQNTESMAGNLLHKIGFSVFYDVDQGKSRISKVSTKMKSLVNGDIVMSINGETPPEDNCGMYAFLRKFFGVKMKILVERNDAVKEIEIESA